MRLALPLAVMVATFLLLPGLTGSGAERPRVAVLNWEARNTGTAEAEGIAEEVRSAFTKAKRYLVVDRTLTAKILEEWHAQQSGLTEQEMAVKVGRLYNVRFIVTGKLIHFADGGWLVSAAMLDTQTGVTENSETLRHQGGFFGLLQRIPPLARTLAGGKAEGLAGRPTGMAALQRTTTRPSPAATWQRAFGGERDDRLWIALALPESGFILAGRTESMGSGGSDGWVLRLDGLGNAIWQRTFGGQKDDEFYAAVALADGGLLLAGATASMGSGGTDGWALRLDAIGNPLWQRTFGGGMEDRLWTALALADGGFLLVGRTESIGSGGSDGWVLRLDALGNPLWQRTFGGAKSEGLTGAVGLQDGGFLLTGWTESMGSGGLDGWVLRLSPQGNPLWQRTFGEGGNDSLHSTVVTPNGEFLVTGSTASVGSGEMDGWALRLGPQGNPLWQSTFGGSSRDRINSALMLPDGGYLLSGETFSMGSGGFDGWTIRLNQQGQLLWQRTFGGGKNDSFNSSISLPDGGFLLAGWTASMGSGAADGWVVRINGEGQLP